MRKLKRLLMVVAIGLVFGVMPAQAQFTEVDGSGTGENDGTTSSGHLFPDSYPGNELTQNNPLAIGTATIDRSDPLSPPVIEFSEAADFYRSIDFESATLEEFFTSGASVVHLEEVDACCGSTAFVKHEFAFDAATGEFLFNSVELMNLFVATNPSSSNKIKYYPHDFVGPLQEGDIRLGPLETCFNRHPRPVKGEDETDAAYNARMQEWRNQIAKCMKENPPREEDGYVPPKKGPKKVKKGWIDKKGNSWEPWDPSQPNHDPHWDVQKPKGGYDNVYPEPEIPDEGDTLFDE